MAKIKQIQQGMMHLTMLAGVRSVVSFADVPNLLVVDYSGFPNPVNVLVGINGLYIQSSDVLSMGESLTVYEIKEALDLLDIKILEGERL